MPRACPHLLAAGLAAALVVTPLAAPTATAYASTTATVSSGGQDELLLNGDRVLPIGPRQYTLLPTTAGYTADIIGLNLGHHIYDLPRAALPYLGHGLDWSLFDLTQLPRTGRLPVTVSYTGLAVPKLPGVTITSAGAGTAGGFLTTASARVFFAALVRLYNHDRAADSYGTDGMFAARTAIRLAGTPAASRSRSMFPMHTITVRGITFDGHPDNGDPVFMFNMDNFDYYGRNGGTIVYLYDGIAKFSLPAGHYVSIALISDATSEHDVINPDLTITGNATVTLDARKATAPVTFSTPKPATEQLQAWQLQLTDSVGQSGALIDFVHPLYVNLTNQHPGAGAIRVIASSQLRSPAGVKTPYSYSLSFADRPDVIPQQHYKATGATLATVTSRYYADVRQTGMVDEFPSYTFSHTGFFPAMPLRVPTEETEYMSAGTPPVYWRTTYVTNSTQASDAGHSYLPGMRTTDGWDAYPLHNPLDARFADGRQAFPAMLSATRAGNSMSFDITPFGDSITGHYGSGFAPAVGSNPSGSYDLDQNGKLIASGNTSQLPPGDDLLTATAKVSADPALFRLTLDANRNALRDPLSTQVDTVWTWRSRHEPIAVLPAGWVCPDRTRNCSSQPLMTLGYDVAGLGLNDVAPAGAQVVRITVGHQQLAAATPVNGVTVTYSLDGGKSWQPASVKGAGTTWYATFSAAAGSKVTLRVSATDRNGGAVAETVWNAYAISGSAASAGYRSANCATAKVPVHCFVLWSTQTAPARAVAAGFPASAVSGPVGWGARDLEDAYRLPVNRNGGTVAVVEMLDTPKLETYLNVYRKQYGLPPCTTANGCFRKVNEYGKASPLPPNGTGSEWDLEATLDVDMVSAACPKCHILVVEGKGAALQDFPTAENTAARLGAIAISNSWGFYEDGYVQRYASAFNHPGHTIVASSGDGGFDAVSFPANLATVTAAGGTQLSVAHNARGFSEAVWYTPQGSLSSGAASGSGCSAYVPKPAWQHDPHCPGRTVADISAVAWNIAIYEPDWAKGGWLPVGGTSASSPLIAGIYALAGNATKIRPGYEYAHPGAFFDITTGNNDVQNAAGGKSCGYDYLCVAKRGYDAPTGLGTPDGIGGL